MGKVLKAPKVTSGDQIDLKPLIGKPIAVMIRNRRDVETKFGLRPVNEAIVVTLDSDEPLYGVLFQSYFKVLKQGEWYLGVVERKDLRWNLNADAVDNKTAKEFDRRISNIRIEDDDVPF